MEKKTIKTTHQTALIAYRALSMIGNVRRDPATQLKLYRLKKMLAPAIEFLQEEQDKLIDELNGTVLENGLIIFPNEEHDRPIYNAENQKLMDLEFEVDLENKIVIHAAELKEISIQEMEMLDAFVEFTD